MNTYNNDFKNNFVPSSLDKEQALRCNFPPVDFVFNGGRHEATSFTKIMELRRFTSSEKKFMKKDGSPNTAYICPVCEGKLIIRFSSKAEEGTKGVIKQKTTVCSCSLLPVPQTRSALVETSYSSIWELQSAVVGFFYGTARIPVVCLSSHAPPALNLPGRGKGFWMKNLVGSWLFVAYATKRVEKITYYHLRENQFPNDNEIENAFIGDPLVLTNDVSVPTNVFENESVPPKGALKVDQDNPELCSCCHSEPGIFRFVCDCNDKVQGNTFCQDCLNTKVSTRNRLKDVRENDPIVLYYDENDKSTCAVCNYGHKVTKFYTVGKDPNRHSIRCPFPIAWLYNRPFFEQRDIEQYKQLFEREVQPIVEKRKRIKSEISRVQCRKNAYREQMTQQFAGWSEDKEIDAYDKALESLNTQLKKCIIPEWAEHPSSVLDKAKHELPRLDRHHKKAKIQEGSEEVINLC